jgi:hypothetical protein
MRRPQWEVALERELIPFFAWMICLYGPPYSLRGPKRSNPYRDVLIYLFGSILRENTPPNRTRPFSWTELHRNFHLTLFAKKESKIDIYISQYDGTYLKSPITQDYYDRMSGLKFAALGVSGIRNAYARGQKIVDLVKQKRREQPDRFAGISVKTVKQRPIRVVELVTRKNTPRPDRRPRLSRPAISAT